MSGVEHIALFTKASTAGADAGSDALRLGWGEDDWSKLLSLTEPRRFHAGEVVIRRGDTDRALYFVVAGTLEVGASLSGSEAGAPIARIVAGSVIGEQAFFDGQPRSANVWAASDGELLQLAPESFQAFGKAHPELARDLLFALGGVLSIRLRNTTFPRLGKT